MKVRRGSLEGNSSSVGQPAAVRASSYSRVPGSSPSSSGLPAAGKRPAPHNPYKLSRPKKEDTGKVVWISAVAAVVVIVAVILIFAAGGSSPQVAKAVPPSAAQQAAPAEDFRSQRFAEMGGMTMAEASAKGQRESKLAQERERARRSGSKR